MGYMVGDGGDNGQRTVSMVSLSKAQKGSSSG